jgi:hypothetical protein
MPILTYDGEDIAELPAEFLETIVYRIQQKVDEIARQEGLPYGKLVSTRRKENDDEQPK